MDFYNPTGSMDDTALDLPYGVAIPSKELNLLMSHHYGAELFDLSADRLFISKVRLSPKLKSDLSQVVQFIMLC